MRGGDRPLVREAIVRELRCAIELRADDSRQSPGRIVGTLMTYGQRASDRPEVFADGALRWDDGGVVLNEQHNRQAPIMRFVPTVEGREVRIDAPLPDTARGRDTATMIRNGTMRGLSVEFRAVDEGMAGGVREVRSAVLLGAAVVDDASYPGRLEVRERGRRRRRAWL